MMQGKILGQTVTWYAYFPCKIMSFIRKKKTTFPVFLCCCYSIDALVIEVTFWYKDHM